MSVHDRPFWQRPVTDYELAVLFGDRKSLPLHEVTCRLLAMGCPEGWLDQLVEKIENHAAILTNEEMDFTWVAYRELPIEEHPEYRTITDLYGDAPSEGHWQRAEWVTPVGYRDRLIIAALIGLALAAAVLAVHFMEKAFGM